MISNSIRIHAKDFLIHIDTIYSVIGSIGTVKSAITRKQIISKERGWYSFDSMEKCGWQQRVLDYLGFESKEKVILNLRAELNTKNSEEKESASDLLSEKWTAFYDGKDELYYRTKLADSVIKDLGKKAKDMAMCMAILRFLNAYKTKSEIQEHTGLANREELLRAVAEQIKKLDLYGLPTSYDRLRVKYYDFEKNSSKDILISGKFGNENTLKKTEEHEAIIIDQYLKANKQDIFECYKNYNVIVSKELGLNPVSYATVKQFCATSYVRSLVAKCRHGNAYYETHVRPFVLRKDPEFSYSLVAGDGWEPGRSVKYLFNGKPKVGTMNVWVWYDWKSRAILSYTISPFENSNQIRSAFRHILNQHGGVCPLSVMVDKKWEEQTDTKSMFEKLGVMVQNKRAYNPKSNIAERTNKELNKLHRLFDEHWVNMTPGFSQDNRHNSENLRGVAPMEESEFRNMVLDLVNVWNNTPQKRLNGRTPLEVCESNINPSAKVIDVLHRTWVFGEKTIVTVRNGYFQVQIASKKYEYWVPNWAEFLKKNIKLNKVKVYYDEKFMDTVDIYAFDENNEDNDRYLYTCEPVERMNVAIVEQTEKDKHLLGSMMKKAASMDEMVETDVERYEMIMESVGLDTASVHAVSQQRYKEARSSQMAAMYTNYMEDQDREEGNKVLVPVSNKPAMTQKEKFEKLRNTKFE